MTSILHITASIRGDESISRTLSAKLVEGLAAKHEAEVVKRDLSTTDIPFVDADRFAAHLAPYAERTDEQAKLAAYSDALIEELQAADIVVLGVPIYNFSVPATLKAWADLVARAGTTFRYTESGPEGMLTGKKAYLVAVSGGTPVGGDADFMTPWLRFFLGFLGITDVELVAADGIMGEGGEETIEQAGQEVERLAA